MERYYRKRREVCACSFSEYLSHNTVQIARLYQPLDSGSMSDLEDDEDDLSGTQLLPVHNYPAAAPKGAQKSVRLTNVWDEREELFGIGDDEDDDPVPTPGGRAGPPPSQPATPNVPKIFVTAS